jgi:hypothetical protein
MARTRTLLQLRTDVRTEGDYSRSTVFTDAILTRWLNLALSEVYDLLRSKWADYYTIETTLVTVAGVDTVALPSDFLSMLRLDLKNGDIYYRINRYPLTEETDFQRAAQLGPNDAKYHYRLEKNNIRLSPQPSGVDTLRISYIPCFTELSADGDTFDGFNGWEDLAVQMVLRKCDAREEKSTTERDREIARLTQRVLKAADGRDAAEPTLLSDNTSGDFWW